jgi:hypothetical protein
MSLILEDEDFDLGLEEALKSSSNTTIQSLFIKFRSYINLTPAQLKDARKKNKNVSKTLHKHYYPDKEYNGKTKFLFGSYGKKTNIAPPRDIDLIFKMPQEDFDRYDSMESNGQSQLLQDVRDVLKDTYTTTEVIKAWGKVVRIEFSDSDHFVEVLPAWENEDGTFCIPNTENGGSWENDFDPRGDINRINQSNKKTNGRTKKFAKMLRRWNNEVSFPFKSYALEDHVIGFFDSTQHEASDDSVVMNNFFQYLKDQLGNSDKTVSKIETAIKRANKAVSFEQSEKFEEASREWKKIFGQSFPLYKSTQKSDASVEVELELNNPVVQIDDSHAEKMPWNFNRHFDIRISATCHKDHDSPRLGFFDSNGCCLDKGLAVQFEMSGILQTKDKLFWQITNTGEEAKLDKGLRGKIIPGNHTRFRHESIKYSGKHWVQCFVVRNNLCIARSEKFYVNV